MQHGASPNDSNNLQRAISSETAMHTVVIQSKAFCFILWYNGTHRFYLPRVVLVRGKDGTRWILDVLRPVNNRWIPDVLLPVNN